MSEVKDERHLIDLDKLITYFEEQYNIALEDPDPVSEYVAAALRQCIIYFKTLQPVGIEKVVRCNQCKSYDTECEYCCFWGGVRHPDHFCGEGEVRLNRNDESIQQEV